MRTLSVLFFAAIACTVAVYGASQSPSQSFADNAFDVNSFGGIQEKIDDVLKLLKCGRDVVGDAIGESNLKADYQQFAHQVDEIIKNELPLCRATGNVKDVYNCLLVNGKKLSQYFYEFVKKVSEENKVIAEKIHNDFQRVCMKKPNLLFMSAETFNLGDQFQCIVDALGEASKANGLADVWTKTQPKLNEHLDAWKKCDNAGSKLKIVFCNIKEGVFVYGLIFKYISSISQNPNFKKFAQDFNKIAQQKCASHVISLYFDDEDSILDSLLATEEKTEPLETDLYEPSDATTKRPAKPPTKPTKTPTKLPPVPTKPTKPPTESPPIHGVWARIKCTVNSITAGVKDTDFAKVWENYMKEFRAIEARIKVCKTKGIWERTKCTLKEYRNASRNLRSFLREFKKTRRESYKRMLKYIWKRCV